MVSVGMIFTLIIALIMIGAIFAFGLPQISSIFGLGGQAQLQKAVKDLEYTVGEVYNLASYSSRTFKVSIPSGTRLCFIDPVDPGARVYSTQNKWMWWDPDQFVIDQMINNPNSPYYQSSLWIYSSDEEIGEGYDIPALRPAECNPPGISQQQRQPCSFCVVGGEELYLENKGLWVEASLK